MPTDGNPSANARGTGSIPSLGDAACRKATKLMHHNYWAHARDHETQLPGSSAAITESHTPSAHGPQQEKLPQWEAHAAQQTVAPARCNKRWPMFCNKDLAQPNISKYIKLTFKMSMKAMYHINRLK